MTDQKLPGTLRIRWSVIGLSGLVLGIGSLGTLVTVVTLNSIDALSTVALVLAVLAFVIQIIVFIAQTAAANQQAVDSQAVNAQTRELLAEVRSNTQQTNNTLADQYNVLLQRVFTSLERDLAIRPGDAAGTPAEGVDLATYREEVLAEVAQARAAAEEELSRLREESYTTLSRQQRRAITRSEQEESIRRYQVALEMLLTQEVKSPAARDLFYSLARRSASKMPGAITLVNPDSPEVHEGVAEDLWKLTPSQTSARTTLLLTDKGEALIRRARKLAQED